MIRKIFGMLPLAGMLLAFASTGAIADTVFPYDSTTGTGPWDLVSDSTHADSGVAVLFDTPFALNSLTTLSATFTDNIGGAIGGSPRIGLYASNGDFFMVYLGTPPSFNDTDEAAFTSAYSGTNLINGTSDSALGNSGSYQTFASLLPSYGTDSIVAAALIMDGGWARDLDLTLYSLTFNSTSYSTDMPLPAALPLFASGAGVLGYFGWRRKKKVAA